LRCSGSSTAGVIQSRPSFFQRPKPPIIDATSCSELLERARRELGDATFLDVRELDDVRAGGEIPGLGVHPPRTSSRRRENKLPDRDIA